MKKKLFLILYFTALFNIVPELLWGSPAFFQNFTQCFSYGENLFIAGGKLKLSLGECRFSTDFSNYNYGVSLFSEKYIKKFPCDFHGGNILIGGIVSRLKNPVLESDCNGFINCYSKPAVITSELPPSSSFSKPFSTFMEIGYDDDLTFLKKLIINSSYTPSTHNISVSDMFKVGIKENISITNSSCISFFTIEENKSDSWYSKLPYYEKHNSFCFGNQLAINISDALQSNFSVFCYESAFGKYGLIYKLENKVKLADFITGFSAFINPNSYLITLDNIVLNPETQIKINFQYTFIPELKSGITAYSKIPLTPPISPDIKFGISTLFSIPITDLLGTASFSFKTGSQFILTYASTKLQSDLKLKKIKTSLTFSSKYYFTSAPSSTKFIPCPELNTQSHSIALSADFMENLLSGSSSFSFSSKNHEIYNKKLKLSLIFNGSYKKIIIILKINGDFCI